MVAVRLRTQLRVEVDKRVAQADARRHGFRLVTDVTRQTFNRANVETPVRTGNLRGHNRMGVIRNTATAVVGEVFNDAWYAPLVHDGTAPHVIEAKRRRQVRDTGRGRRRSRRRGALKFTVGGRTLYRRRVMHPGTRGRPWLADAARQVAAANGFTFTRL